jgi:hypothetical protein
VVVVAVGWEKRAKEKEGRRLYLTYATERQRYQPTSALLVRATPCLSMQLTQFFDVLV